MKELAPDSSRMARLESQSHSETDPAKQKKKNPVFEKNESPHHAARRVLKKKDCCDPKPIKSGCLISRCTTM